MSSSSSLLLLLFDLTMTKMCGVLADNDQNKSELTWQLKIFGAVVNMFLFSQEWIIEIVKYGLAIF